MHAQTQTHKHNTKYIQTNTHKMQSDAHTNRNTHTQTKNTNASKHKNIHHHTKPQNKPSTELNPKIVNLPQVRLLRRSNVWPFNEGGRSEHLPGHESVPSLVAGLVA